MSFETQDFSKFVIKIGADFVAPMTRFIDRNRTNPFNLTGFTAKMEIRKKAGAPLIVSLTTENGGITLGGTAGTILLFIDVTDTEASPIIDNIGINEYDLFLIDSGGDPEKIMRGCIGIEQRVTE